MRFLSLASAAFLISTGVAQAAASCGGNFGQFVSDMRAEAVSKGYSKASVDRFFSGVQIDPKVLKMDRSQGIFKMSFVEFSQRVISNHRMVNGAKNATKYASVFKRAQKQFGVDPSVILAFWALETDFGAVQGDFNTLNALVTLSHDCRRPELFRPQVFAALELYERGDFDPASTTGAWAGEIGMVQMLPEDILHRGVDGDGDGQVSLKTSAPDAIMTGARMLRDLGWRANQPWLVEVTVPGNLNWAETGLETIKRVSDWAALGVKARGVRMPKGNMDASIVLPQGRKGPAFMALPNFNVYFEWNQSFVYVTTAAYFATRLAGAPLYDAGNPDPALSDGEMKSLQKKLQARGYDVGKIDGILGARTRGAIRREQIRLGLPADAWPTKTLLSRL